MSENKTYSATVARVSDEGAQNVATATGRFAVANFAVKEAFKEIKDADGEFRVTFSEVDADGTVVRQIVSVTADSDVSVYIAKKKIAAERKALNPAEDADASETASE